MHYHTIVLRILLAVCSAAVYAEPVVVVNPKNTISALTPEQASNLFLKKTSEFPGGDSMTIAVPVDLPAGNVVRDEFYNKMAKKNYAQVKAYWAKLLFTGMRTPPKELFSAEDVKKFIATTSGAIGYIDKNAVDSSVKVVQLIQ